MCLLLLSAPGASVVLLIALCDRRPTHCRTEHCSALVFVPEIVHVLPFVCFFGVGHTPRATDALGVLNWVGNRLGWASLLNTALIQVLERN